MKKLSIVCASSLAGGRDAFATIGDVTVLAESEITAASIQGASLLATRSKVKVNDKLLAGTSLAFYGTATAGTDHVDAAALEARGIAWAAAPGSNANSVAEYIIAALARLGVDRDISWRGKIIAIIGAGHVGSRLARLATALGMHALLNDPPLQEQTGDERYRPLDEVLAAADVVSLHVPLTDEGAHATRGMAGQAFFSKMKPGSVFLNASRGEVVREDDLLTAARAGVFSALVLDVFDREPAINPDVVQAATLVSPHIAGYSLDARLNGTEMVYRAACRHFGLSPSWEIPADDKPLPVPLNASESVDTAAYRAILHAYDPATDDRQLRAVPDGSSIAQHFQRLRQHYAERREFRRFQVAVQPGAPAEAAEMLRVLGFTIKPVG